MRISFLIVAAVMAAISTPAAAQDAGRWYDGILIGFQPLIAETVMLAVAALLAWLVKIVRDRFGIEIEAKHREALQSALNNAINLAIAKVIPVPGGGAKVIFDTVADLDVAVKYVKDSVPDAVKRFGLDDARIEELLKPKLAAVAVDTEKNKPTG